mmetsp:Transcript_23994/g.51942  ORF Transcript_23994/g.51942 Transcript_23994/m.51942 type:complete len:370 (-) Transcript_23994:408-1517(-)
MKLSTCLRVYFYVLSRFILGATAFSPFSSRSASSRVSENVQSAGGSLSSSAWTSPVTAGIPTCSRSRSRSTVLNAAPRDEELFHRSLLAARLLGGSAAATSAVGLGTSSEAGVKSKKTGGRRGGGGRKSRKEDDCTAYVGNLPYDATESQVRALFEEYGTVTRIYMPTDRDTGAFRGFAFVSLASRESLLKSVEALDQNSFFGRTIYANESLPKRNKKRQMSETKLYVGNISFDTTADDLKDFFGQYGTVHDVYIPLDRDTGSPRGFAFVKMGKDDSYTVLDGANGETLNGRTLSVSISLPRGQKSPKPEKSESFHRSAPCFCSFMSCTAFYNSSALSRSTLVPQRGKYQAICWKPTFLFGFRVCSFSL